MSDEEKRNFVSHIRGLRTNTALMRSHIKNTQHKKQNDEDEEDIKVTKAKQTAFDEF